MNRKEAEQPIIEIEDMMKKFRLVDMRECYLDIIREARETSMDYEDFLRRLLEVEMDGKIGRRQNRLTIKAGFEDLKYLEDIDYSFNPSIDKGKLMNWPHSPSWMLMKIS